MDHLLYFLFQLVGRHRIAGAGIVKGLEFANGGRWVGFFIYNHDKSVL